jgi:hypothetical protein
VFGIQVLHLDVAVVAAPTRKLVLLCFVHGLKLGDPRDLLVPQSNHAIDLRDKPHNKGQYESCHDDHEAHSEDE